MCQYSATAEMTRPARQGDKLIVTKPPHGHANWLTEPGHPETAVCILHDTTLAVEALPGYVRGARFDTNPAVPDHEEDAIVYLDGKKERVDLDLLSRDLRMQVLAIPKSKDSTAVGLAHSFSTESEEHEKELVAAE